MNAIYRKIVLFVSVLLTICLAGGCNGQGRRGQQDSIFTGDLGATIGSLVQVIVPESVQVEGYGLIVGLDGTGSSECPPEIRIYLKRFILKQLPANSGVNVDSLIDSPNTAVVLIEGIIPTMASKNAYFDMKITALPNTQTTSLDGGRLFTSELKIPGNFGVDTRILADAEGPIFIDKINDPDIDKRTGYILAGGKVLNDYKTVLALNKPDFGMANRIRNRINGRFGSNAARAIQSDRVELTVPAKYKEQKQRFVDMVAALYLEQNAEINSQRISTFVNMLSTSQDKYPIEVALEAIGNECIGKIGALLNSSDERTRLHAARCMLNLGSDAGLVALRQIALNEKSAGRIEALESIAAGARRSDAVALSRRLLRDDDFEISLTAYEQLRKLDDIAITQEFVGRSFYLERVTQTQHKTIFVSRSGQPCIVLFGSPIQCAGNIFVTSQNGEVIINSAAGQEYVSIIRKHPKRPNVIAQLKSSFELGDIIRTLCDEPPKENEKERGGLGVSYADAAVLLKLMCDKGAVRAEFHAGTMPKIGLNIKK